MPPQLAAWSCAHICLVNELHQERPAHDLYSVRRSGRRSIDSLTVEDLTAPPRPWPTFLRGGAGGAWSAAYDVPSDLNALQERFEANALHYLVRPQLLIADAGSHAVSVHLQQAVYVTLLCCRRVRRSV